MLIIATPRAKLAVVTMPMAASAPMTLLRVVRDMRRAERKPQMLAPHEEIDRHNVTYYGTAEYGMREAVADVGHAAEDDVDADQATQASGEGGGYQALDEEFELKGFKNRGHGCGGEVPFRCAGRRWG